MNQYQYAVDSQGRPVYYKDARKGETYYCIECGQEMLFCSGDQRTYYRHKNSNDVNTYHHSTESYLHKTAKLLYAEKCKSGVLRVKIVPRCCDYYGCNFEKGKHCLSMDESKEINLMEYCEFVGIEETVGDYRADILLKTKKGGSPVLLEVCVTHKCDRKKLEDCKVFEVMIENEEDIDLKLPVMYVDSNNLLMDYWDVYGNEEWMMHIRTCPYERPQNPDKYMEDLEWYMDNSIELSSDFRYNCMLCKSLKGTCDKKWDCPGFRLAYSIFYPRQYRSMFVR